MRGSIVWQKASVREKRATGYAVLPRPFAILEPRDEAVFLLHTAAEVEHSLLVQYLYAAYSLVDSATISDPVKQELLDGWYKAIHEVARQEMGHLATVQNLLWSVGGPLNFDREDFPYRGEYYPFHFRLERISRDSIAKYVISEMPPRPAIPPGLRPIVRSIRRRAVRSNRGANVNRVGALYAKLIEIVRQLPHDAFRFDSATRWQALPEDFGFVGPNDPEVLTKPFIVPVANQSDAVMALRLVAEQGEGAAGGLVGSHFDIFLTIYRDFPESNPMFGLADWVASRAVPTDPSVHFSKGRRRQHRELNCIRAPVSRLAAILADLRYRISLTLLPLYLRIDAQTCATERKMVAQWIAEEMRSALGALATILPTLPRQSPNVFINGQAGVAAAPFTLPYSLDLPHRPSDCWRLLGTLIDESQEFIQRIRRLPNVDPMLLRALTFIEQIDAGRRPEVRKLSEHDSC